MGYYSIPRFPSRSSASSQTRRRWKRHRSNSISSYLFARIFIRFSIRLHQASPTFVSSRVFKPRKQANCVFDANRICWFRKEASLHHPRRTSTILLPSSCHVGISVGSINLPTRRRSLNVLPPHPFPPSKCSIHPVRHYRLLSLF